MLYRGHFLPSHQLWGMQDRDQVSKWYLRKSVKDINQGEHIQLYFQIKVGLGWVSEPCWRTKMWFGPVQEGVAIISCNWLKYISGISHMSRTMKWNISGRTSCQTVFLTYFLSLHVRHFYINKILLKFNILILDITIILTICDSLQ